MVHFHAVIRLDATGEGHQPPPAPYDAALLCEAIGQAVAIAVLPVEHDGQVLTLTFGTPQGTDGGPSAATT